MRAGDDDVLVDFFRLQLGDGRRDGAPCLPEGFLLGEGLGPLAAEGLGVGDLLLEQRLALGDLGWAAVYFD